MRQTSARRSTPPWLWPLALVLSAGILAVFGRTFVYGLLGFLLISAGVAFVLVLLWGFLAMTRSGHHGALNTVPHRPSELARTVAEGFRRVRLTALQAPWRSPQKVVRGVIALLDDEVLMLASTPSKYPQVTVSLDPSTVALLDTWMPLEKVALIWAEQYATVHADTPPAEGSVTVLVVAAEGVPVGRAIVQGSFRSESPREGARALARCTFTAAGVSSDPGRTSVERFPAQRSAPGSAGHLASAAAKDTHTTDGHPTDAHATDAQTTDPGTQVLEDATDLRVLDADPDTTRANPAGTHEAPRVQVAITVRRIEPAGLARPDSVRTFQQPRVGVGRRAGSDLVLADTYASRQHAELRRQQDRWVVTDGGSTHGTYLNGTRIPAGAPQLLRSGDRLQFGDCGGQTPTYVVEVAAGTAG